MFTYNLFPKLLNKVAQEVMSDSDKLIEVITHYQQALEHYAKKKNDAKMLHCIFKLSHMPITRKHLEETGVGRTVNSLRRLDEVGDAARTLVAKWKDMVSKQDEQVEEEEEEEGEEEMLNIKSDTSKDIIKKLGQRDKTDDNRNNSSHRNSDKGEKFSNHIKEKHKVEQSSRGSHVSASQKDHKERHARERRRSYERHSDDDERERSQSYQKELDRARSVSNLSDSETSASNESVTDEMTSDSGHESDTNGNLKSRNSKGNKVESRETKRHSESHSKDKRLGSNNSDRKSHKSSRSNRSNSKERTHSKSKEHPRDKSREKKKKKEDDKYRDLKKDSAKRKREHSDSSDSEHMHKKHRSSESSKHRSYDDDDTDSDSSQEAFVKEISDDEIGSSSLRKDAYKKDSGRKEKERKESHRSSSHHNSSKSENKKHSEKSKDSNKKEKSCKESTKNDKKSDKKSDRHESKSKSKPINEAIIKTENGICSSFGASFADALGMLEPTTSKGVAKKGKPHTVTSTPEKLKPEKSPEKKQSSKSDVSLPSLPSKLEPIDIDISSLLPTITPNYRPLGNYIENIQNSRNKILNDDEALSMVMSSKNQRTKVYSGNKIMWDTVPTLFELCTRILQDNIDALEYTGGVPYCILKPVLDKATPDQLFIMEHHNPYLMEDTDELWQLHCQREFRNKQREEMETWREMYMRCLDEREAKLKTLKANIKQSQEKSTPVRKTQLAYIDSVVKPPRNILKKQMKSGIEKRPAITPASRLTALATSGAAGQIVVPNPGSRASSSGGSSSAHMKPKKAPLMQKTLQFLKGGRFRR